MAKRALCLGINEYKLDAVKDLRGCVNDAQAWQTLLVDHFDFAADDVKVLVDKQATRSAVLDGLKTLLAGAQTGDVLVFINSSHGSYTFEKGEDGDEPEGVDEVLCTHDYGENLLVDDDIREIISTLPAGVNLTVISDSCHSGELTRDAGVIEEDYVLGRSVDPKQVDQPALDSGNRQTVIREAAAIHKEKFPESGMRELLLSACRPDETAQEAVFEGNVRGAMTYFAIAAIQEANYQMTWRELHKAVDQRIQAHFSTFGDNRFSIQKPQLEGTDANKDRQIFT